MSGSGDAKGELDLGSEDTQKELNFGSRTPKKSWIWEATPKMNWISNDNMTHVDHINVVLTIWRMGFMPYISYKPYMAYYY